METPPFLRVDGELARLIAGRDWSDTLGAPAAWPPALQHTVATMLRSPVPQVLLWGADGVMIYNDAYSVIAGGRHPELLGSRVREGWAEVADFNDNVMRVGLAGGTLAYRDQELVLHRHGRPERVWLNLDYSPVVDEHGTPQGVIAIVVETTGRIDTERALRESEARLRFLDRLGRAVAGVGDADAVLALTTRMLGEHLAADICAYADMDEDGDGFSIRGDWAGPGHASIVGHYSLADFGVQAVRDLSAGRPLVLYDIPAELETAGAATFGAIGIAATICMPLVKAGRLTALMAVHQARPRAWTEGELALVKEVTERSWAHVERVGAEAERRSSESRYQTLFGAIDTGFCIIEMVFDGDGRPVDYLFLEANPAFQRQAGFGDPVGRRVRDIIPTHEQFWFDLYGQVALTGEPARIEHGSAALGLWWDVHAFRFGAPEQRRVAVLFEDVTPRRRSDLALRELNETLERRVAEAMAERKLLADIVQSTDAIIMVVDADYRWLAFNRAAEVEFSALFGVRPQLGLGMLDALADQPQHRAEVEAVWRRALAGERFTNVSAFGDPGRLQRTYEMKYEVLRDGRGRQIGAYQFAYDITDRVREQERLATAEEQLRQAQKMESLGQLTGGVAHDFNNLLTPIVGALDMLQRRGIGGPREQRLVEGALQSAERAATLVQRLLAFARRQPLQATAVDVGRLVHGMSDLIASTTGPKIRIVTEVEAGLPAAMADPNQLEMALLNLSVNARDAMPEGGVLRLSATAEAVGEAHAAEIPPGVYVRLSVADTGAGMDEATLSRAVEPFFSTKGVGKGTGLGLSMVHGLTLQLGGGLTIHSAPGEGAEVVLWLPATERDAAPPPPARAGAAAPHRGEALLVDDEDAVRVSVADMLRELGYGVQEARSAEAALSLLDAGLRPDLIVTDHLMPGLTGTELAQRARQRVPGVPVLIVSGYAELEGLDPALPRLSKPFRSGELAAALAALAAPAPA